MLARSQPLRRLEAYLRARGVDYGYIPAEIGIGETSLTVRSNWDEDWGDRRHQRYLYITEVLGRIELFWGPGGTKLGWSWARGRYIVPFDPTDEVRIIAAVRDILVWLGWS